MITLYEYLGSPNCARARLALEEARLPYRPRHVDLDAGAHRTPRFFKLNPTRQLPVLVDGRQKVFGSNAILLALAERHPEARLLPASGPQRAQAVSWLFWVARLNELTWGLFLETRLPAAEQDRLQVRAQRADLAERLAVLEEQLRGRRYIAGTFSLTDLSAFPTANLLERAGAQVEPLPNLLLWRERMRKRPSWAAVRSAYYPPEVRR